MATKAQPQLINTPNRHSHSWAIASRRIGNITVIQAGNRTYYTTPHPYKRVGKR